MVGTTTFFVRLGYLLGDLGIFIAFVIVAVRI